MRSWKATIISAFVLMPVCYCLAFLLAIHFGAPLKPFNPGEGIGTVFIFITTPIFIGVNIVASLVLAQRLTLSTFPNNIYLAGCLIAPFLYAAGFFITAIVVGGTLTTLWALLELPKDEWQIHLLIIWAWLIALTADVYLLKVSLSRNR